MPRTESNTVKLGAPRPASSSPTRTGLQRLESFAASPALLVAFISNRCPFVLLMREELAQIGREYADRGLAIVAINSNDARRIPRKRWPGSARRCRRQGYGFPYLKDGDQSVAKAYGAACTPDLFLFDAERRLAYHGQFDDARPGNGKPVTGADLRAAVDAVLAGQPPADEQVPSDRLQHQMAAKATSRPRVAVRGLRPPGAAGRPAASLIRACRGRRHAGTATETAVRRDDRALKPTSSCSAAARPAPGRRSPPPRPARRSSSSTRAIRHQRRHRARPTPAPGAFRPASTAPRRWRGAGSGPSGLADQRWMLRCVDRCYENLQRLVDGAIRSRRDESGKLYIANLRGPDYMRFMRTRVLRAGVKVLDHHPALELLSDGDAVTGAAGLDRAHRRGLAGRGRRHRPRHRRLRLLRAHPRRHRPDRRRPPDGGRGRRLALGHGVHGQVHARPLRHLAQQGPAVPLGDLLPRGRHAAARRERRAGRQRHRRRPRATRPRADRGPGLRPARPWPSDALQDWLRRGQPNCFAALRPARHRSRSRDLFRVDAARRRHRARHRRHPHRRRRVRAPRSPASSPPATPPAARTSPARSPAAARSTPPGRSSSGWWAGKGAAALRPAPRRPGRLPRRVAPLGTAGPAARRDTPAPIDPREVIAAVRAEVTPLGKNYFRDGAQLCAPAASGSRALWREVRAAPRRRGHRTVSAAREAAGVTAAARWSLAAALARTESRGMHRRTDLPAATTRSRSACSSAGSTRHGPRRRRAGSSREDRRVMIEIVSEDRCIRCDICERVCPAFVFDRDADGLPDHRAAGRLPDLLPLRDLLPDRRALRVAASPDGPTGITEAEVEERQLFGSYARALGWSRGRAGGTENDPTHHIRAGAGLTQDKRTHGPHRRHRRPARPSSSSPARRSPSTAQATDRVTVLAGVDLDIRKGEFITLVGPSGSGKSVLLDIVGGLTEATRAARPSSTATRVTRPDPKIAYVFQQYALFPWRTALENVEYALEVRGVGAARAPAQGAALPRPLRPRRLRGPLSLAALGRHAAARGHRPRARRPTPRSC